MVDLAISAGTVYALRSYFCLKVGFDISGPTMPWLDMATKIRNMFVFLFIESMLLRVQLILRMSCSEYHRDKCFARPQKTIDSFVQFKWLVCFLFL